MDRILDEIASRVSAHPEKVAVTDGDIRLTFATLDRLADMAAQQLTECADTADRTVAYIGSNGISLIVALLATQKAGLALMPINPAQPEAVVSAMLSVAKAGICLSDAETLLPELPVKTLRMPTPDMNCSKTVSGQRIAVSPDQISILHCTSGSTGKPKIIPHSRAAIGHFSHIHRDEYRLQARDVVMHTGAFWVESILSALSVGATVACFDVAGNGANPLIEWLLREGVTVFPGYPAMIRVLESVDQKLPDLRLMLVSGEPCTGREVAIFERLTLPGAVLLNCYGCQEYIWATSHRHLHGDLPAGNVLTLGRPVGQFTMTLLNDDGEPVDQGEIGNITICGAFVPREYTGDFERTEKVFGINDTGQRTFKTGDVAWEDEDGRFHCLGRSDDQLKIRGFNVRPADVEHEVRGLPGVDDVAVTGVANSRGVRQLACHYTGSSSPDDLKAHLRQRLPAYMIPQYFIHAETLPKTLTGKIRKIALVASAETLNPSAIAPITEIERALFEIWARVLGHNEFGVEDDFHDVGGDSLLAMEMLLEYERAFGKRLALDSLVLGGATIRALGQRVQTHPDYPDHALRVMKSGDGAPAIHVVHVYDGGVSDYLDFAQASDRASQIIGITANYFDRSRAFSIEAKAREAVQYLPRESAMTLMGYSYGALVAVEIARLIGRDDTRLILIDPYTPFVRKPTMQRLRFVGAHLEKLVQKRRPTGRERAFPADLIHNPAPLSIARTALFHRADFPTLALEKWRNVIDGPVDEIFQPGTHGSMMRGSNAMQLANRVAAWRNAASPPRIPAPPLQVLQPLPAG